MGMRTFPETPLHLAANFHGSHGEVINLQAGQFSLESASITGFPSNLDRVVSCKATGKTANPTLKDGNAIAPQGSQACSVIVGYSDVVPLAVHDSLEQLFLVFAGAFPEPSVQSTRARNAYVDSPAFWIKMNQCTWSFWTYPENYGH